MAYYDLFYVENPEVIALALGVLAFVLSFSALRKTMGFEKGSATLVSLVIGLIGTAYIYSHPEILESYYFIILFVLIAIVILVILYKIAKPMFFRR